MQSSECGSGRTGRVVCLAGIGVEKGGAKRKPYTRRRLRGGGGGGGGGGERAVAWGFRENLEASFSFSLASFRAAPRGAEERGGQGGDERVWRPLLWSLVGAGAAVG